MGRDKLGKRGRCPSLKVEKYVECLRNRIAAKNLPPRRRTLISPEYFSAFPWIYSFSVFSPSTLVHLFGEIWWEDNDCDDKMYLGLFHMAVNFSRSEKKRERIFFRTIAKKWQWNLSEEEEEDTWSSSIVNMWWESVTWKFDSTFWRESAATFRPIPIHWKCVCLVVRHYAP